MLLRGVGPLGGRGAFNGGGGGVEKGRCITVEVSDQIFLEQMISFSEDVD